MQKKLHKNRRISECIIDTDLKFWNIRFKTWINISYQIIFFHIMHSFWVISSSKAFRSGRVGPGRAGSHQKWILWVKMSIFCFYTICLRSMFTELWLYEGSDIRHQRSLQPRLGSLGSGRNEQLRAISQSAINLHPPE